MVNKKLLQAEVYAHGDFYKDLAAALGITHPCLSGKIHGRTAFTCTEVQVIKERYSLTPEQIDRIFFADRVS